MLNLIAEMSDFLHSFNKLIKQAGIELHAKPLNTEPNRTAQQIS